MSELVCFGEVLWDCYENECHIGGAPFNVAAIAKAIDIDSVMITAVGKTKPGQELLHEINRIGVQTVCQVNNKPTGKVKVKLNRRRNPTFEIAKDSAYDYIQFDDELGEIVLRAKVFCFGTLAQRKKTSRETLRKLIQDTSATIVYDVNLRPCIKDWEKIFEESAKDADVIKVSDCELEQIRKFYKKSKEERDLLQFLIEKFHLNAIFITRGEKGGSLFTSDGHFVHARMPRVKVVDTTGCGDAFTAAIVSGILNDFSDKNMLEYAVRLASKVATFKGAVPEKLM